MKAKMLFKQIGATLYEHRSDIEFVVGTGLVIAGTGVIISKAEEITEVKHEVALKKQAIELKDEHNDWDNDKERRKACFEVGKTAVTGYTKALGVGVGMQAVGLTLQGISKATDKHTIADKTIALSTLAADFYAYRQNVREDLGDAKDEEYLLKTKKPATVTVDENGNVTQDHEDLVASLPDHSFLIDECHPDYNPEGLANLKFAEDHERWINQRLQAEGYLTENDIRRECHAPVSKAAARGDYGITAVDDDGNTNYISFGINKNTERAQAFREGTEKSFLVILDNMEPNIHDKLYRLNKYHRDVRVSA